MLDTLNEKLNSLQILPYYYVPECPLCMSGMTGRIVKNHRHNDIEYVITESLKHGELVKPLPEIPKNKNAFCLRCGHEWNADIEFRLISINEMREEKAARFTNDILAAKMEEENEKEGKKKRIPIFSTIKGFVGLDKI